MAWNTMKVSNVLVAEAPKVLLQHGIQGSSMDWVINSVELAPAFMLARAGFDVWLGNSRGNKFSRKHKYLKADSKAFWDFDFEEMGLHD